VGAGASIVRRSNGKIQVRWRDGGRGSAQHSRDFSAAAEALAFKKTVEQERRLGPFRTQKERDRAVAMFWGDVEPVPGDELWSVASYIRRMVEAQDLRPTTRGLYLRNLRLHVEDTNLGRADLRYARIRRTAHLRERGKPMREFPYSYGR
jgi:hypothetical protein